ncbi:hypothetical protein G7Z17_g13415 [Cylindrodendrum hubeiense]|uniref:Uncharacterized protein n=1 Tax=Cylindrodendrum hubeiense TaxID=595255 RepID=A0A9P5L9K6_9HYPO|nr:hypothetical protein G7Z17_g13415 [Cylindrodendrum hubeiense]
MRNTHGTHTAQAQGIAVIIPRPPSTQHHIAGRPSGRPLHKQQGPRPSAPAAATKSLDGLTNANDMSGPLPFGPRAKTVDDSVVAGPTRRTQGVAHRSAAGDIGLAGLGLACSSSVGGRYALVSESMGQGAEGDHGPRYSGHGPSDDARANAVQVDIDRVAVESWA